MTGITFIKLQSPVWEKLEKLVEKAHKRGISSLEEEEIRDLVRLYPALAIDVARARMLKVDGHKQKKLNELAIAAHCLLYRRKSKRYIQGMIDFFVITYPELFRRHWLYLALASALFLTALLSTYTCVILKPSNAYLFVPGQVDFIDNEMGVSEKDISERFRRIKRPPLAAGVMVNNITVAFNAFALGITAGLGTCLIILYNGMMMGGFAAHFANNGLLLPFCSFIAPHGVLEIFAILIAAAAGLRLGISLTVPGKLTRSAALRKGAYDAVMLVLGTIPMFIIAGFIEGFITPSYLTGTWRIMIGLAVWSVVFIYLLFGGKKAGKVS